MKKIFVYILAGSLCFSACKKDDDDETTYQEPEDITVQNTYDDQSIQKFLDENYLDVQGNIKPFSSTDSTDDNYKKLSELNPVKLPSGVVYIIRDGAQPSPGKTIVSTTESPDVLKLMVRAQTYVGASTNGNVAFISKYDFVNTIDGSGSPIVDPMWFYVKKDSRADKERSYYEIEGFQEGLQYFKAFDNLPNEAPYNLQGVIIVPSRAAFARDSHYGYNGVSYRNRSFVFNFQVYNASTRTTDQEKIKAK
ncbi:hypothetical protein [Chryseobacterium gossypii]|uniref:hypothetical protein n=1 Tax=Chryseobacterium gossypii TaxID=3231602 RepID=UPI003523B97D